MAVSTLRLVLRISSAHEAGWLEHKDVTTLNRRARSRLAVDVKNQEIEAVFKKKDLTTQPVVDFHVLRKEEPN